MDTPLFGLSLLSPTPSNRQKGSGSQSRLLSVHSTLYCVLQRLNSEREGRREGKREGRRERGVGAESSYHAFLGHLALTLSALEL